MGTKQLLTVKNLKTYFYLREGILKAVDGIDFNLDRGEVLGLVGESGCGKSMTARTILRMVKKPGRSFGDIILKLNGSEELNLISLDPRGEAIRKIRGNRISMVFQEPMNALSPVHSIGNQIIEGLLLHYDMDKKEAREESIELLKKVGISNPEQCVDEYPHQLSGGMRQRVMIAIAISCNPDLLLADEPTTALDVSIQAQILSLLKGLQQQYKMSIIFITHDLAVIAQMADRVAIMYLGKIVEEAEVAEIFYNPLHPYTKKLLQSIPDLSRSQKLKRLEIIKGSVPEPINLPERCVFYDRCAEVIKGVCDYELPSFVQVKPNHKVSCYQYKNEGDQRE